MDFQRMYEQYGLVPKKQNASDSSTVTANGFKIATVLQKNNVRYAANTNINTNSAKPIS